MSAWVTIARAEDIPPGHAARVEVDGQPIAIFNVDDEFFAVDDTCTHAEASLSEGELDIERCTIECPLHGSCFDLRDGEALTLPAVEPVQTYDVAVHDGMLQLAVAAERSA